MKEHGEKLPAEDKDKIESSVKELKDVLANADSTGEEIKAKVEVLNSSAMKLGEMMYKESQEQAAAAPGAEGEEGKTSEKEADVVDADFEEVKPDEKDEKAADK